MDKKAIETLSVNAVRDSIVVSDFLDQFIADNDKEPSWDGFVYIYKNKIKKKDNLKGRLAVQVKGTENGDLLKDEISFSVSVTDLNNYLYDGGIVFFVVYIGYGGLAKQIYYAALPPIKIRVLLSEAIGQKNKTIRLKKFPNDPNEKAMIFFNCWEDCRKQSSFSSAKLFSLEELENQGVLEGVTLSVSTVGNISPKAALFTNEIYLYANIKGSSIPQPIEAIPYGLTTSEERPAQITVGGKVFYDKVHICQNAQATTTTFGESFSLVARGNDKSMKMNYKNSTKIRTLSVDLDFMLAYISHGSFQYNGVSFPFDEARTDLSKFSLEKEKKLLNYVKKIVQMLDIFGCEKDIDVKTLTAQDWRNIDCLITALVDKKEVTGLKENLPGILSIVVGDLKFLLSVQKVEGKKGTYKIFDFFKTNFFLVYENQNGEKKAISQYAILHAEDFIQLDNICFDVLLPSFQNVEHHNETIIHANCFLLDLLKAFDKSDNKIEILNTAKDFSDWIMTATEEELSYDVRLINKLQIIRRLRPLNIDEVKELFSIIECPDTCETVLVGAYLLLNQKPLAELHFNNLDKKQQEEFKQFPIWHFWIKNEE